MINNKTIAVVVPAYNEEKNIVQVIENIPEYIDEIIVINDGSEDNTKFLAESKGATVLNHKKNKGVGMAFRTGVEYFLNTKYDIMVNIDGDGQFNPSDIKKLIDPIVNYEAEFVTASRFIDRNLYPEMPGIKFWGNKRMANLISVLTKQKFYDVSCGFRAYSRDTLLKLNLFGSFTYTQETFLDLAYKDINILEIPIQVKGIRSHGKSRVASNLFKYTFRTLNIIFRAFKDYKPMRFFGMIAFVFFVLGFGFAVFFFTHYLVTGAFQPHIWSGFLASFLMTLSFLIGILALISDILARIKRNQENILYHLRKNSG